ncbi:hypothetical protein [Actinoplanes regularis]|uniref:hypothetical protein n=1 Tax=Actinoplanes regularis TaxID=52697 RepID=UPI0024A35977|nr:hypothetical protein [Actinoplanes regularis]GLW32276.1 hypothetical protein Areg01_52150 [Actinoplanes regularis]
MPSLGSFGRKYDRVELDFEFFGATIRANPEASQAALIEFMAGATNVSADDEIRSAVFIMDFLRQVIHPDDFGLFWKLAKAERQDPMRDLMPIGQAIVEAVSGGFPTGQSSDSSPGPTPMPPRFEVDLPSGDVPPLSPEAIRSMHRLDGRPDLQLTVLRAQEAMNGVSV